MVAAVLVHIITWLRASLTSPSLSARSPRPVRDAAWRISSKRPQRRVEFLKVSKDSTRLGYGGTPRRSVLLVEEVCAEARDVGNLVAESTSPVSSKILILYSGAISYSIALSRRSRAADGPLAGVAIDAEHGLLPDDNEVEAFCSNIKLKKASILAIS